MRKFGAFGILLFSLACCLFAPMTASALQSTNFRLNEPALGGFSNTKTQSTNFQASESGGILGIGNSTATNTQVNSGNETTDDPALTFVVNSSNLNFGNFSPGTTAVTTSTFEVTDYTSYGYIVQMIGMPPTNGSHTIEAMATTGPSQAGVEQFGINLVANTSPSSLGANPDHGQFGFGDAATNYDTPNNYRFVSGETVATGPKSSGKTVYTVSYIVNVSSLTPGGKYNGDQTLLCIAVF